MSTNKKTVQGVVGAVLKIMPLLLLGATVLGLTLLFRNMTVTDILNYVPENLYLAALAVLLLYALKSLSILFPLMILYIGVGTLFPPLTAVLVNLLGLCLSVSIPFFLGRLVGSEWVESLVAKNKRAGDLRLLSHHNEWFLSYMLRVINLLPGDLVSMLLGASRLRYWRYLTGSLCGLLPTMLAATFLGVTILEPLSPAFLISLGATVLLSVLSMVFYWRFTKRAK